MVLIVKKYSYSDVVNIPHNRREFDYVTISKGMKGEQSLLIGIWLYKNNYTLDDYGYLIITSETLIGYYPMNRDDSLANLEWHLKQYTFDYELSTHGYCKFVKRPVLENING